MGFERNRGTAGGYAPKEASDVESEPGNQPDYRVVQASVDADGKNVYTSVGAIWVQDKKADGTPSKVFANLKIGALRLLVFKNDRKA